jgi:atypical dual specificity phosphatase
MQPRPFSWLLPEQLGASVDPSASLRAATELRAAGVGLLVNLYERPDPPALLLELQAETLHLPVHGSEAPTEEQLVRGISAIDEALERGIRVAVHCGAGLGRTGTLLAAYLVSHGCAPDEAIARVRAARPGSVETEEQELAVHHFARRIASPEAI